MKVTLKDGSSKEYASAMSIYDIAMDISEGLARVAVAGEVDGEVKDLRTTLTTDCTLNILTANDEKGLRVLRHTCSHVMAEAVKNQKHEISDLEEAIKTLEAKVSKLEGAKK